MALDQRNWQLRQLARARRAGGLLALGLLLAAISLWSAGRPPELQSNHALITSSPWGAIVYRPAHAKMGALRLG